MQTLVLSEEQHASLQSTTLQHLAGFATAPAAYALKKGHVFELLKRRKTISLEEVRWATEGNIAYLQLALNLLCAQDWVRKEESKDQTHFTATAKGLLAFELVDIYRLALQLMPVGMEMGNYWKNGFTENAFVALRELMQHHEEDWHVGATPDPLMQKVQDEILDHIEGLIVGPILVALSNHGFFEKVTPQHPSFLLGEWTEQEEQWQEVFDFLTNLAWFTHDGEKYKLTAKAWYLSQQAMTYGRVVAYLSSFAEMSELLYGNPRKLWENENEATAECLHRNESLYNWAKAGTPAACFENISVYLLELFDQPLTSDRAKMMRLMPLQMPSQESY